jgi:GTP-binding protein HflX
MKSFRDSQKLAAILVDIAPHTLPRVVAEERLFELEELTKTYGGVAVVKTIQRRAQPDHRTFIGSGKVEQLKVEAVELGANVIVVNDVLKPQQLYALTEAFRPLGVTVWDRIELILYIFDRHATSAEAKLQIELARLRHIGPRIYGMGQQLGRQRGGTGTRGGGGEGNTEVMKRHLRERERAILAKLETHEQTRALQRARRTRTGHKTVAIVGYTNAGKTTLLNRLTGRKELAANALFATLDTRVGTLKEYRDILVSDTIGFIRDLPPSLIAAFRSTLSEAVNADLLLWVVDVSDPRAGEQVEVVRDVLKTLGVEERMKILVANKVDKASAAQKKSFPEAFLVSALQGEGVSELISEIVHVLSPAS